MITGFHVSESREKLNIPWVCAQLRSSYWGGWLKDDQIQAAISRSLCFGLYADDVLDGGEIALCGEQIGFGRVVTDGHTFSSIMDIMIDEKHRNRGLGTMLMNAILAHQDVRKTICIIGTADRAFWYEKFGFKTCVADILQRDPQ